MFFKPTVLITLDNLNHNYNQLNSIIASNPLMIMVKADDYGHGLLDVTRKLESVADYYGVARLSEAVDLINTNIKSTIVLMEGFFDEHELIYCISHSLDFVIHHYWQLDLVLKNSICEINSTIWIKVNTGMNRLGFLPEEVSLIHAKLSKLV